MSVFTEILKELAKFSAYLDTGKVSTKKYYALDELMDRIMKVYYENRITLEEQKALWAIAKKLHKEYSKMM